MGRCRFAAVTHISVTRQKALLSEFFYLNAEPRLSRGDPLSRHVPECHGIRIPLRGQAQLVLGIDNESVRHVLLLGPVLNLPRRMIFLPRRTIFGSAIPPPRPAWKDVL
jgi:hypothetical protein